MDFTELKSILRKMSEYEEILDAVTRKSLVNDHSSSSAPEFVGEEMNSLVYDIDSTVKGVRKKPEVLDATASVKVITKVGMDPVIRIVK